MKRLLIVLTCVLCGCASSSKDTIFIDEHGSVGLQMVVPHFRVDDSSVPDALAEVQKLWVANNPESHPEIIIVKPDASRIDDMPRITLACSDKTVVEVIGYICNSSGWEYKIVNGNIVFWLPKLDIVEPWTTKTYSLTPLQIEFFGMAEATDSKELGRLLEAYDIEMPEKIDAKAKWEPNITTLVVHTYSREHLKIEQLLRHITLFSRRHWGQPPRNKKPNDE